VGEVAPGGDELWTSSGNDLLAYDLAAVRPGAPAPLRPVRRLAGAVPPSGVTGAAFYHGRLFLAGQDAGALQLWSVDVSGATAPQLELELPGVAAESEASTSSTRAAGSCIGCSPVPAGRRGATYGRAQRVVDLRARRRRPAAGPRGAARVAPAARRASARR